MAAIVFNVAKGAVAEKVRDGATIKALILKAAGLEADGALRDHATVAALLAATNDEADFTSYARRTLAGVAATVDQVNDRVDVDCNDVVWNNAGGAANNQIGKIVFYEEVAGGDANCIPLFADDFATTTDGSSLTYEVAAGGFYRAA